MKHLFNAFVILFVMSMFSGCKITSSSPDPSNDVKIQKDDTVVFSVEGPAESPTVKYEWRVVESSDNNQWDFIAGNGKSLPFNFGSYESKIDPVNRLEIVCRLSAYRFGYFCHGGLIGPLPSCGFEWVWQQEDVVRWSVVIADPNQNPPVWEGSYVIKNDDDQKQLEGFTELTGNLNISGSSVKNLDSLGSIETIGGRLTIRGNEVLTSLGLESVKSIGKNYYRLRHISDFGNALEISGNPLLCEESAQDFKNRLLEITGVTGLISIFGNMDCIQDY